MLTGVWGVRFRSLGFGLVKVQGLSCLVCLLRFKVWGLGFQGLGLKGFKVCWG